MNDNRETGRVRGLHCAGTIGREREKTFSSNKFGTFKTPCHRTTPLHSSVYSPNVHNTGALVVGGGCSAGSFEFSRVTQSSRSSGTLGPAGESPPVRQRGCAGRKVLDIRCRQERGRRDGGRKRPMESTALIEVVSKFVLTRHQFLKNSTAVA